MNEKIILYYKPYKASATDSDSVSKDNKEEVTTEKTIDIDYKQIEDAYYNALKRVETEKANREALEKAMTEEVEETDLVQFASSTDARLYTATTVAAPASSAQQQVAYLLDIRNILLIFLLSYFVINVYTKLKNTLSKYYGGND